MKKTIEEVRDYLLENRIDAYGNLDISGLDFSEFVGDILISFMIVNGDLYQDYHKVHGDLHQRYSKYGGELYDGNNAKMLKEITIEELAKMGYKLKTEG